MNDLEVQQYLFDLQGYLVIENALSAEEVATLNHLIDAQNLPPPEESPRFGSAPTLGSSLIAPESVPESRMNRGQTAPVGSGFLDWGKAFCDLLDHPAIMPVLRFRLGDAFRLDRLYGMYHAQRDELRHAACRLRCNGPTVCFTTRRVLRLPQQPDLRGVYRSGMGFV